MERFSTKFNVAGTYGEVQVIEAVGTLFQNKHRYFLAVGGKFKPMDADLIGTLGYMGCTKAEAIEDAKSLDERIQGFRKAIKVATGSILEVQVHSLAKILDRYSVIHDGL